MILQECKCNCKCPICNKIFRLKSSHFTLVSRYKYLSCILDQKNDLKVLMKISHSKCHICNKIFSEIQPKILTQRDILTCDHGLNHSNLLKCNLCTKNRTRFD